MILSSQYGFVRARQLEGSFPGDPAIGVWGTSSNRIVYGWGTIPEDAWPRARPFSSPEPDGLDELAKRHRLGRYQRIRDSNECRVILAYDAATIPELNRRKRSGVSPLLGAYLCLEITQSFIDARRGMIGRPPTGSPILGSHSVVIIKDQKPQKRFEFWNSWGTSWGDDGHGSIPYSVFDEFMIEAWAADAIVHPEYHVVKEPERAWEEPDPLGTLLFGMEVNCVEQNERMGWAFACLRDEFLDIEELFVRPQYRRRGIGDQLVEMLKQTARKLRKPMRAWVPFVDCYQSNRDNLSAILKKLELSPRKSGVPWAGYVAHPGKFRSFDPIRIPPVPAHARNAALTSPPGPVVDEEAAAEAELDRWAAIVKRARLSRAREDQD